MPPHVCGRLLLSCGSGAARPYDTRTVRIVARGCAHLCRTPRLPACACLPSCSVAALAVTMSSANGTDYTGA
ncbi:hypothetical protein EON67_00405 [archaeon]|nr:MAG: hypothetical protein EON67_00405 [archaeon]